MSTPNGPDVRLLHDPQRVLGGLAAAEPVRGVGQPVEVQSPGEDGGHGGRGDGGEQRARAEPQQQQPEPRRAAADDQADQRRAQHPAARGRAVPAGHPYGSTVRVPKAKRRPSRGEAGGGTVDTAADYGLPLRRIMPGDVRRGRLPGGPGRVTG